MAEVIEHTRSSFIFQTVYDQQAQQLDVMFRDGAQWRYFDVPRGIYTQMITSPSVGKAFHQLIKDRYEGEPA